MFLERTIWTLERHYDFQLKNIHLKVEDLTIINDKAEQNLTINSKENINIYASFFILQYAHNLTAFSEVTNQHHEKLSRLGTEITVTD